MKLLLDTHIWIWSLLEPDKLGRRVVRAFDSPDSELWLSPISTWELLLLVEKGRVELDDPPDRWLDRASQGAPLKEAPLTHAIARASRTIRLAHQDPADRFLAATAAVLGLTLVTADDRLLRGKGFSCMANR